MSRNQILTQCLPPKGIQIDQSGGSGGAEFAAIRRRTIRQTAAQYLTASGVTAQQTVYFQVHNPSPRLRCKVSVGWELTGGVDFAAGAGSPTWAMRAVRRSEEGGAQALLNQVFTSPGPTRALPDAYEMDTAMRDARGTLVLNATDLATGLTGNLVIEATWEPNGPPDDESVKLLQEADLRIVGTTPIIQNTS